VKTVGLVARPELIAARSLIGEICERVRARGLELLLEQATAELAPEGTPAAVLPGSELGPRVDLLIVLGGDGTLLVASHLRPRPEVPVLAVNFGSLGFLTEVTLEELYPTLDAVLAGHYAYDDRRLLRAAVRSGATLCGEDEVLNDVVVTKASLSRMLELDVSVDGRLVSEFRADGLILSSPTGSTAYNLAAGGPIVQPLLPAVVLTPICPHMLTHRPLVLSDQAQVEVRLRSEQGAEAHVTFDGQRGFRLEPGAVVSVTRSTRTLRLVKAERRDYFEVLRTKLMWGEPTVRRR